MVWVTVSLTANCSAARAPDLDPHVRVGTARCVHSETGKVDVTHRKTRNQGCQAGPGLGSIEDERHRAEPLKRALEPGTTTPNVEIRAKSECL